MIDEFKVEEVVQQWNSEADSHLSKRLTNTNAFASREWSEGKSAASFAIGIKNPLVVVLFEIKPCRLILVVLNPLRWIVVN